ncbi:hypothetical protein TREMEDRAFT_73894 [Tremella mesenterica DSM 1558]|uniref:uncharacterized protein n=1 Tax=Tremella mesenterica (strain ATCC 24925 / CBS 8224 / DSM 1558 / NBRC 9311 / NRRL Y-6157 / RJB 2259-6 / UBC 559-6) TaxID=578456 RepID=UPI0003F49E75|nr:uncharacterized protein TREMEDRAFT_73894 [Tremella mesenterica DSM 1558]EIW69543.1 hypothetical protein TREMEDRAFT_73894 [Tremella mesenterica DSM 1558]
MARLGLVLVVVSLAALTLLPTVHAFGAGNIPSYSYLEEKAYRHGDIEDVIAKLFKTAAGGFLSRGTKFSPLDVKRVYFGNWLRDYSQAVDVGALKKTNIQTILNVCLVLGFLAHGYVTAEFEVTKERLGCYLPTEHIDNPKGYADGEDARQYDDRLRPPVDPRELEIDPRTGMKNYIANEGNAWDTSKSLVRRVLQQCIHYGRQFRVTDDKKDAYEAFRLLGQALHTLEDFPAHSNFCELGLISLGHQQVFPHVGRNVTVRSPQGRPVHPLVTGTFGGADFIHSLLGETTDHLSEASVSDLSQRMTSARSISDGQSASSDTLRQLFFSLPGGDGEGLTREMEDVQSMRAGQPGGVDPSTMSPQDLHRVLWQVLAFRDSVMKKIEDTSLGPLVEKISNSVSVFILTTIEPFVKPLLGTATSALGTSSQAVIDSHDQYEVWNDFNASDPTHSFLSKDHFALLLNEPAGKIASVIVEYSVNLVVKAWDNPNMPTEQVTEPVLECLFHPDFFDGRSQIQRMMLDTLRTWIDTRGKDKHEVLNRLTSDNVRAGKNRRIGDTSENTGHVHNSLLPEGGLQAVLAQHNVHVPGAQVLNAGQDLLGGKLPWQPGFGAGGPGRFREFDPNAPEPQGQSPYPAQPSFTPQPNYEPGPQYSSPQPGFEQQRYNQYQPPSQSPQPSYGQYESRPSPHPHHHQHHSHEHHPHHQHEQEGYPGQNQAAYPPPMGYDQYGQPMQYGPPPGQYGPPPGQWGPQQGYGGPPGGWGQGQGGQGGQGGW